MVFLKLNSRKQIYINYANKKNLYFKDIKSVFLINITREIKYIKKNPLNFLSGKIAMKKKKCHFENALKRPTQR